jgi:hypothetical protein
MTPLPEMYEASFFRSTDVRDMVSRKCKRWQLEENDHLHSYYPQGGEKNENYGYRDEAEESGTKCVLLDKLSKDEIGSSKDEVGGSKVIQHEG